MNNNILAIAVIFIFLYLFILNYKIQSIIKCNEKFTMNLDDNDQQGINNFMSLLKGDTVTLKNLNITNNLTVSGAAAIGKLNIVNNKIQFPGSGYEIAFGGDQWVRTNKLNSPEGPGESYIGGFAGSDLWCLKDINLGGNINIGGNTNMGGHLTVKNGSDFFGGRHYFTDSEGSGRIRVGNAWGKPGIYAEDGKDLMIGASSGWVRLTDGQNMQVKGELYGKNVGSAGVIACMGGNLVCANGHW